MKTSLLAIATMAILLFCLSCSKTDPIPGVTNAISFNHNGSDYSSPATFVLTTKTETTTGANLTYSQVVVTSVSNPVISLTFGFSNTTISGYAGLASQAVSTYNLTSLPNVAFSNSTKAASGTLSITSYDGTTLNGTFSFTGPSVVVTNGQLTGVKKI